MLLRSFAALILAGPLLGRGRGARRVAGRLERWTREPRSAVLIVLFSVLVLGGGRKLLKAGRARKAVERLGRPDVSEAEIADAAEHGRAGLMELFRILGSDESRSKRDAAGRALAVLWARDEMIAEEEKALVRRGYQVDWKARRRYPRGLKSPIPVAVTYGVPFLADEGKGVKPEDLGWSDLFESKGFTSPPTKGVKPENLEWSHRVLGARRASLEVFGPWVAGQGDVGFELIPSDFETDGPHRLVLQTRVRTVGLTERWEFELPHTPFNFEFDARLAVEALFALPDETRAAEFSRAVRLVDRPDDGEALAPRFLALNDGLAIRDAPAIEVTMPIPCDLAHAVEVEFEGVHGWFAAGELIVCEPDGPDKVARFPLAAIATVPDGAIGRPGTRSIRARLVPDPDWGWSDPEVRSIWPGTVETDWVRVEIVRR